VQAIRKASGEEEEEEEEECDDGVEHETTNHAHGSLARNSSTHADIRHFVAKQKSKAIATKELVLHLIFLVVSFNSYHYLHDIL
jgi:hypothetical protein